MEQWKSINEYEGYYEISSFGRVKNTKTGNILNGDVNSLGYKRVVLYSPVTKRFFIHRLVAYHFVDGYNEGLIVNHKDGNKQNNNADNLELVTRSENDLHAFRIGLRDVCPAQFRKHIESYDLKTGETIKKYNNVDECCNDLRVARSNVYSCCNHKQKSCRGVGLRYV